MSKKFVIVGITCTTGVSYAIGEALQNGDVVTSITYNRADCPFNKGYQLSGASYTIKITNGAGTVKNIRILVPLTVVANVVGEWQNVDEPKNPEATGLVEQEQA